MAVDIMARSAQDLLEQPLGSVRWIVEDLISTGLVLLVGPPKTGKSWAALQLGLCVSLGMPFLGCPTAQGEVLYLCLEDTFARIQQRLFRLTDEANDLLCFATEAEKLQGGLIEQLEDFVDDHPDTCLVIIDTFQTVRGGATDNAYASDYADMSLIKGFADEHGISVLIVHHTRKMGSTDVFDTVSGTTAITGAADETMVLTQVNRGDGSATLSVTGRDIEFSEYKLRFRDCRWELIEKTSREELEERDVPPSVLTALDFMAARTMDWAGTASELIAALGIEDVRPNVFVKYLNENSLFMRRRGVEYARSRSGSSRTIYLNKIEAEERADG